MAQRLLTRKEFLREAFTLFRKSDTENNQQNIPQGIILPPGAVPLPGFLSACTQCFACVSNCPYESIRVCRQEQSDLFGYPVIQPRLQPCYECEDLPCIAACTDGALIKEENGVLGTAVINRKECLAYSGQYCMSCINTCPYPGKAIFRNNEGIPEINSKHCTGCGLCEYSCPTEPVAIQIQMKINKGE